jgi:hypothetical protein
VVRIKFYLHKVLHGTPDIQSTTSALELGSKAKMEGGSRDATTSSSTYRHQRLDHNGAKSLALQACSDLGHDQQ